MRARRTRTCQPAPTDSQSLTALQAVRAEGDRKARTRHVYFLAFLLSGAWPSAAPSHPGAEAAALCLGHAHGRMAAAVAGKGLRMW